MPIESLNAITLATHDMTKAVAFYESPGFETTYGGPHAIFTSLRGGQCFVNLTRQPDEREWVWWGRVIGSADSLSRR